MTIRWSNHRFLRWRRNLIVEVLGPEPPYRLQETSEETTSGTLPREERRQFAREDV
jgi:hypothetical protein